MSTIQLNATEELTLIAALNHAAKSWARTAKALAAANQKEQAMVFSDLAQKGGRLTSKILLGEEPPRPPQKPRH